MFFGLFSISISSRECQVSDWPTHKTKCRLLSERHIPSTPDGATGIPATSVTVEGRSNTDKNKDIWEDVNGLNHTGSENVVKSGSGSSTRLSSAFPVRREGKINCNFTPRVDFEGANQRLIAKGKELETAKSQPKENSKTYLHKNAVCSDLPTFDPDSPNTEISVKSNKEKHKIQVNNSWSWGEVTKIISHRTEIPLEKMKIIAKGKMITEEALFWTLASQRKMVFQVIGVKAENEDGLTESAVNVVMNQMSIDRNDAVRALKSSSGNVVDAMLNLGNR